MDNCEPRSVDIYFPFRFLNFPFSIFNYYVASSCYNGNRVGYAAGA